VKARVCIAGIAACLLAAAAAPSSASATVALQPVGNFASPIYVTAPPGDPRLFVVQRGGTIEVLHDGVTSQFLDIHGRISQQGEGGLLSMAFDPNYAANGLFYVFYTGDGTNSGGTVNDDHVDEFHVSANPNVADTASERPVLYISRPNSGTTNHHGGQLQFGPDGMLYISVGDGGTGGSTAQNPAVLNGKLLRINPHAGGGGPEIWSMGLRNPFRFSFDRLSGDLVIGDVGETSWEEIDFATNAGGLGHGANYGWPCREGFVAGPSACTGVFTDPVFAYPHSDPGGGQAFGHAIIGGFVYRGTQVPELAGRYVYADLTVGALRSQQLGQPFSSGDRAEGVSISNPNSFGQDGSCELYVISGSGPVDKIVSTTPPAVARTCPLATATKKVCKRRKKHKKHHVATTAKKHKKHKKHKKKCRHKRHKKKGKKRR
jgi:glucose/arabinose dehydrogenase